MAPVPIFGEHLLYDSIDHAINAGKGPSNVADSSSGWGDWSWGQAYSDWSPPEPRLFEDASIRELSQWEKFTESLFAADSWFGSWPSDKDTFMKAGSLAEFEDTGDGVVGDMPNLIIPQDEWWDLPRPKIPMSLDYQKPSSPVTTGRLEVPVNITTAQDVPLLPTRPTHIWPSEMIIPPTQYDPKRMVQEYGDKDWFLTKRWGMKVHEVYYIHHAATLLTSFCSH